MFLNKRTFLDFAAGALPNPSSPHAEGRAAHVVLEKARESIARLLECKTDDVIFTSGATEANALAILGLAKHGAHFLYLPSAHASVVENMKLAEARGVRIEALPIKDARVDVDAMRAMLRSETVLVSMDAVCGETGVVWNTREVAVELRRFADMPPAKSAQAARPIQLLAGGLSAPLLHVDASQAPLTEKLSRAHFGADLLVLDGGKVGVRGIGCLIAPRTIPLAPLYAGGGQERGLRSGTENVEAAGKFAAALRAAANGREAFIARARSARAHLVSAVVSIPNLFINEGRTQAPNILNLSLPGRDTDYLLALLDEAGFGVSTRSACETGSEEGSRAVMALTGDRERAQATLRVSWGPQIRERVLARFATALAREVAFIDREGA